MEGPALGVLLRYRETSLGRGSSCYARRGSFPSEGRGHVRSSSRDLLRGTAKHAIESEGSVHTALGRGTRGYERSHWQAVSARDCHGGDGSTVHHVPRFRL